VQYKKVNPLLDDIFRFGTYQLFEIAQFVLGQHRSSTLRQEPNISDATIKDKKLGPAFPSLALSVHMHGFMLVGIKNHNQTKIFVKLRHQNAITRGRGATSG